MNDASINRIASFLRTVQWHRLQRFFAPAGYVRVTYTHEVMDADLAAFDATIGYLRQQCRIATPDEFFDALDNRRPFPDRSVMLTFDDGLRSSYRAACEVLDRHGVKAVFFVPTAILDLHGEAPMRDFVARQIHFGQTSGTDLKAEQYELMSADDLLDLARRGHTVLPHTHNHRRLSEILDEQTAAEELARPQHILQELLGRPVQAFAFPVGTERVVSSFAYREVRRLYRYCFTALSGVNTCLTDPHFLHRDCLHGNAGPRHVCNMLDGIFDSYYLLKMRRLKSKAARPAPVEAAS